jgi:PPK2 family polyphosphate:nucleotide phosphotransferase
VRLQHIRLARQLSTAARAGQNIPAPGEVDARQSGQKPQTAGKPMKRAKIAHLFRIEPGTRFRSKDHPTDYSDAQPLRHLSGAELKERARDYVQRNLEKLSRAQELLYANDVYSVLILFQAMDAAGKDGMIKHVMSGLNPQGCQVASFKVPSAEELDHNFLWRYQRHLPERGRIGIFNRSYYEEVLVVRVHPELLERQKLPPGSRGKGFWKERYEDINALERHLARNGTLILKFFLHLSKEEQKKRFLERLTKPEKHWKFSAADLAERAYWDDYRKAYEAAITATSTPWAPWYVIPADHKWVARAAVSAIVSHEIEALGLKPPQIPPARLKELEAARRKLARE